MRHKKNPPAQVRLTAYVTREEHAALIRRAKASRRTLADETGLILAAAVSPEPNQPAALN